MSTLDLILCIALVAVSGSSVASIFFVCKLVEKVTKLNAAPDVLTYQRLMALDRKPKSEEEVPLEPTGQTSGDGTLTDEALAALASVI